MNHTALEDRAKGPPFAQSKGLHLACACRHSEAFPVVQAAVQENISRAFPIVHPLFHTASLMSCLSPHCDIRHDINYFLLVININYYVYSLLFKHTLIIILLAPDHEFNEYSCKPWWSIL